MSLFDHFPSPPVTRAPRHGAHPALSRLRATFRRLRIRLVVVNAAALAVVLGLTLTQGNNFGAQAVGPFNLGMLLLGAQGLVVLTSALLYDRACTTHCDPRVDELHAARTAAESAAVAERRWRGRR